VRRSSRVTRARILRAARALLNERGVGEVTVRDVALRACISHGNLCYHFPNMGAVIEALYHELVAESDAATAGVVAGTPSMALFYRLQAVVFDLMLKYRFLFLDLVAVFRTSPRLRRQLRALKRRRAREFAGFVAWLDDHGLMGRERYAGERELLFLQYDLMSDFWIGQAKIMGRGGPARAKALYQRVTFSILLPHLSRTGLKQCGKLGFLEPVLVRGRS